MATPTFIPIAEYLTANYRPDREYIDGRIVERNLGRLPHSRTQALLAGLLGRHEQEWGMVGLMGPRVQVSPDRIRVPDYVLVRPGPQPDVLEDPPLLIVEIRSPEDTRMDCLARVEEYSALGVGCTWIIDPWAKTAWVCAGRTWTRVALLSVPGLPIYIDPADLFGLHTNPE
jgi:Uma2 family endonuclease